MICLIKQPHLKADRKLTAKSLVKEDNSDNGYRYSTQISFGSRYIDETHKHY